MFIFQTYYYSTLVILRHQQIAAGLMFILIESRFTLHSTSFVAIKPAVKGCRLCVCSPLGTPLLVDAFSPMFLERNTFLTPLSPVTQISCPIFNASPQFPRACQKAPPYQIVPLSTLRCRASTLLFVEYIAGSIHLSHDIMDNRGTLQQEGEVKTQTKIAQKPSLH